MVPISIDEARESRQFDWIYRIAAEADQHVLQMHQAGAWSDLYAFTLERQHPVDYEMANHYTSTHPSSRFVQVPIAQRTATDVRRILRDHEYSEHSGDVAIHRTLADDDEIVAVLAEEFDLRFPLGTRFQRRPRG